MRLMTTNTWCKLVLFGNVTVFLFLYWCSFSTPQGVPSSPAAIIEDEPTMQSIPPVDKEVVAVAAPPPRRWPENLNYPNCEALLNGNRTYIRSARHKRVKMADSLLDFETNCSDFHDRGFYPDSPLSAEEAEFPIAYAIIVFKDFVLLEKIFNVIYAPQNFYCYSIDSKASETFKTRVRNLAKCFPNVVVPDEEFSVKSSGHKVVDAHLSCMRALQSRKWNYLVLLQNHDIPMKTNAELVRIFKIFNGANDVSTFKVTPISISKKTNWTLDALHLYRDDYLNKRRDENGTLLHLRPTKSLVAVSLTHMMVDFILNTLNVTELVAQLQRSHYGVDENFISTLNSNDLLEAPGGFTTACLDQGIHVSGVTRSVLWAHRATGCGSKRFRHTVCIYGVEDLQRLSELPALFVNKMLPSFDFGAATCWLESVYNRTYFGDKKHVLDTTYYEQLPHVRYNKLKQAFNPNERVDLSKFNCSHHYDEDLQN